MEKTQKRNTKNSFMIQGAILAGAGIVTKIIGFVYRIPVANMLGDQGNGIYSVAFSIYNIALTLSSYSLPLAVSKLVSARLAKKEYKNSYRVFVDAMIFALIVGCIAFAVLFAGADFLAAAYGKVGRLERPLRVLAPTVLVVAFLGVFRGFFQGMKNMMPTAISQIIEQVFNAAVSIIAAWQLTRMFADSPDVHSYGAMGSTFGTLAGAVSALSLLLLLFFMYRPQFKRRMLHDRTEPEENSVVFKALILTIIPVILSQTIYQIGHTIDDFLYSNIMQDVKHMEESVVDAMQGVYSTQYNQLVNLPVAIATALAATTIPSIVQLNIQKKHREARDRITSVIKLNMVIAIPAAVGMAVLARPIMTLLFPNLVTYRTLASNLLTFGSSAIVFYALSTITTAILQGSNYMRLPVIHSTVSLVLHIILVVCLLRFTNLDTYGLMIGNASFPLIVSLLNCYAVSRRLNYHFNVMRIFASPLFCSAVMGIATWSTYQAIYRFLSSNTVALASSIVVALVVYLLLILGTGCFSDEELVELPMGLRILRFKNKLFRK